MILCPKCGRRVYSVCSNSDCKCHNGHDRKDELIYRMELFGRINLPLWFGNWLWKMLCAIPMKPYRKHYIIVEVQECPHCGYKMLYDCWDDLWESEE